MTLFLCPDAIWYGDPALPTLTVILFLFSLLLFFLSPGDSSFNLVQRALDFKSRHISQAPSLRLGTLSSLWRVSLTVLRNKYADPAGGGDHGGHAREDGHDGEDDDGYDDGGVGGRMVRVMKMMKVVMMMM